MIAVVNLYSKKEGEVNKFLSDFYNTNFELETSSNWKKEYKNPVELAEIIGVYADNYENYLLKMLISLDKNIFIHVTNDNANEIIKYLYERFPY